MAKPIKKQILTVHYNLDQRIFHVSSNDVGSKNSTLEINIAKAQYIWKQLNASNDPTKINDKALSSGFMLALINTNYTGWQSETDYIEHDYHDAELEKQRIVSIWTNINFTNVGARKGIGKGVDGSVPSTWNKKWNIENMTISKVLEKIDFIGKSLLTPIPNKVKNNACLNIIGNKGQINSLGTLLLYIRREMNLP